MVGEPGTCVEPESKSTLAIWRSSSNGRTEWKRCCGDRGYRRLAVLDQLAAVRFRRRERFATPHVYAGSTPAFAFTVSYGASPASSEPVVAASAMRRRKKAHRPYEPDSIACWRSGSTGDLVSQKRMTGRARPVWFRKAGYRQGRMRKSHCGHRSGKQLSKG